MVLVLGKRQKRKEEKKPKKKALEHLFVYLFHEGWVEEKHETRIKSFMLYWCSKTSE